jgi:hypothetical protein
MDENLTGLSRLWLAFAAFFAVLFDRRFAQEVQSARRRLAGGASTPTPTSTPTSTSTSAPAQTQAQAQAAALHVLHLLQRDGRLVDFLSEDLAGFSDAEIGGAARTVHEGCRKTLAAYLELEPVYREAEGAPVTVGQGFDPAAVRLTGNVVGAPPFTGSLKHHGWRVTRATFPQAPVGEAARILAPAEVEL